MSILNIFTRNKTTKAEEVVAEEISPMILSGKAELKWLSFIKEGRICPTVEFSNKNPIMRVVRSSGLVDNQGMKQGQWKTFSYDFAYKNHFPNEEKIGEYNGDAIVKYPSKLSTYKDDEKEGEELSFDRIGRVVKVSPYKKNRLHGIETIYKYEKNGNVTVFYSQYENGELTKSDGQLRCEWTEKKESLKVEKEMDKKERSDTLKKVLEASSKEEKKKVLKEFHSQQSPANVKRRTALKFDR